MVKRIIGLVFIMILVVFGIMMIMPQDGLNFNFAANKGMWQVSPGTKVRFDGDTVSLKKGSDNFFIAVPGINLGADRYDVCIIEMKQPIAYEEGRLFFISQFNKGYDRNFSFPFDTGKADKFNKIYIDLKKHGAWQGIIREILIIPAKNSKTVSIKSISFVDANPWTKMRAWYSDFTRYGDPLLGTCFSMASPIFLGRPFNMRFIPILWWILGVVLLIVLVDRFAEIDPRIKKSAIGVFFLIIVLLWGALDLRNNIYYLKAISRNISLYWGKPMQEKRGIVVGDQEFIDFMKFCNDNIPIDARVFNQVPVEVPGTASNYLSAVQYLANFRPRFYDGKSKSYYIFYKPKDEGSWELYQQQVNINEYLDILPGEKLQQEIELWHRFRDLYQINLWIKEKDVKKAAVEVIVLDRSGKNIVGRTRYVKQTGDEAVFRFSPRVNIGKGEKVLLQIKNKGKDPIGIGNIYGEQYREGFLIRGGRRQQRDLTFRLIYRPKGLALFKRFNNDAYILMDRNIK
ncbi:MAG: hypothetical protein U9R38_06280 [Candidatus Margulisiibacteriota bacterium]|nr:hypothetical protein [Candidatus Margulisiibacteriota bacterium]